MVAGTRVAAEALAGARPQVAVFGCTSAGALLGSAGEKELLARLSSIVGCAVLSVNACIVASAAGREADQIALLTPYTDEVARAVATRLEEEGMRVVRTRSLGLTDNNAVSDLRPRQIADEITTMRRGRCPRRRGLLYEPAAVEGAELAAQTGPPIVTSNSAVIERLHEALREPAWVERRRRHPAWRGRGGHVHRSRHSGGRPGRDGEGAHHAFRPGIWRPARRRSRASRDGAGERVRPRHDSAHQRAARTPRRSHGTCQHRGLPRRARDRTPEPPASSKPPRRSSSGSPGACITPSSVR